MSWVMAERTGTIEAREIQYNIPQILMLFSTSLAFLIFVVLTFATNPSECATECKTEILGAKGVWIGGHRPSGLEGV
jgi:hypothetical protein